MVSSLFGSSPSTSTVSTTSKEQQQIQALIGSVLQQIIGPGTSAVPNTLSGKPAFPSPTGGTYAAPLTPQQTTDINAIQSQAGPTSSSNQTNNNATAALTQILSGQPQDYSQYFETNIAAPLEQTFSQQTLPAIKAAMARSAGGTYSGSTDGSGGVGNTGYDAAINSATESLNTQLEQAQSNLTTSAVQQAIQDRVQGVALAPSTAAAPINEDITALGAATLPQSVAQTQLAGQTSQYNSTLGSLIQLLGGGTSLATSPTQEGLVQGGSTGLIPGLLGGLAGNQGLGTAIGSAIFSDPRVKDSEGEENGKSALDKIINLKVERAKYKGEPEGKKRPMVMADDVKREFPKAVPQKTGGREVQTVNMADLLPTMIAAIQELAKQRKAA